ncbi:transposase [Nonomuraea sp. NPDC049684]|uniref:transposase n=1 Tax=Nonomuraea sp. NPDC049684 TaxID=3364356 RepID=UPI00378EACAA
MEPRHQPLHRRTGESPRSARCHQAQKDTGSWLDVVDRARSDSLQLTSKGGLQQLTKRVLESALEGGITDHLGYDRHEPASRNSSNSRTSSRAKAVVTDVLLVGCRCHAMWLAPFEPQLVRQRRPGRS